MNPCTYLKRFWTKLENMHLQCPCSFTAFSELEGGILILYKAFCKNTCGSYCIRATITLSFLYIYISQKISLWVIDLEGQFQTTIHVKHQIMFKIAILSQIGADRYQKLIFEILFLPPPWRTVYCSNLIFNPRHNL